MNSAAARLGLVIAAALVVPLVVPSSHAASKTYAQAGPIVTPNLVADQRFLGPEVVISGKANSDDGVASVAVVVQNTDTNQYVQNFSGGMGSSAVSLSAWTAKLPPGGSPGVTWRVPLTLSVANYQAVITSSDSNSATSSATVDFRVVAEPSEATQLIQLDATWAYFDGGKTPENDDSGTEWHEVDFVDTGWPTGPAELGYGDGDEATEIASSEPSGATMRTAYFRHRFELDDVSEFDEAAMKLLRDDGAIVYVNGVEVDRSNMPQGTVDYDTFASSPAEGPDGDEVSVVFSASLLSKGTNVVAVEVHQATASSSDLSFRLSLQAEQSVTVSDNTEGVLVLAAGDMAKGSNIEGARLVADKMEDLFGADAGIFIGLGDLAYNSGTYEEFMDYYDPTIGRMKDVTWPSTGNHEHLDLPNSKGYRRYFGSAAGPNADTQGKLWYSFDLNETWHMIALDSDCETSYHTLPGAVDGDGCAIGSDQERWLREDLEANKTKNILAFFHHPSYTNSAKDHATRTWPLWRALSEYGAEIVLVGHDHHYERYGALDYWGDRTTDGGMRQFIVGSGGTNPRYAPAQQAPESDFWGYFPVGERDYGVLQLWLQESGYEWRWEPIRGLADIDSGSSGLSDSMPTGSLKGKVVSAGEGEDLAQIEVCVTSARSETEQDRAGHTSIVTRCDMTDDDGQWAIAGLVSDDYGISYESSAGLYAPHSDSVGLTAPQTIIVSTAELNRIRSISGKVTVLPGDTRLAGVTVCASPGPAEGNECVQTDSTGTYKLTGFIPGRYQIKFSHPDRLRQCYNHDVGCGGTVKVVGDTEVIDIDASMRDRTGDVTCEGELTMIDALLIARHSIDLLGASPDCPIDRTVEIWAGGGDANGDGNITMVDALIAAQCAIGIPNRFLCDYSS